MKKIIKILLWLTLIFVILCWLLSFFAGPKPSKIEYGVTFSPYQAQSLNLDWKKVYLEILTDLKIKHIRIGAYWNKVEPEKGVYNFSDLDFQITEAQKNGAKIVLSVGRRLPRWPECHDPLWIKGLKTSELEQELLSYIYTVVSRYQGDSSIEMWQVENEPFLNSFGICPKSNKDLLDKEIALVKKIDPVRSILISDSGELSLWLQSGKRGDVFGTTLYRFVFSDVFNRYWVNYIPYWFYRVKGGLLKLLNFGKPIMIIELQAEPWTTKGILNTPIDEQFKTMRMKKFESILSVAKATGFSPQYLWGVEWWYWMKGQAHPEFWETVKVLVNNPD